MIEKNSLRFAHLAINGGAAAVSVPIPGWPPEWPEVRAALQATWDDGSWGQYHGSPVQEFTEAFAEFLDIKHVWPCSSGTIAVELALRGLGVAADDEVILGGYDFPGNFRAIEAIGARPVLIDVKADGYVINEDCIPEATTEKTKVIIASHLHGQMADISGVRAHAKGHDIAVLEDACQAPGAVIDNSISGTLGDVGVFSFGGSKLLTAGRGGAIVTESDAVMQRIRIAAERGNDAYPLSTLQAAVLKPQLATLSERHQQRLAAAIRLREALRESQIFRPLMERWGGDCPLSPAFFKFAVQVPRHHDREFLMEALRAEGVPVFTGFRGFARRSKRRCHQVGSLEHARAAADNTILLHHPFLLGGDDLIDQVVEAFKKVESCFPEKIF